MATTPTTTQTSTSSLSILADYELHHSGSEVPQLPERVPVSHAAQPASWPSNYRRIPAYRPVDRELDQSERPAGSNPAEFVLIQVMLHGVWLNAVSIYAKSSNWIILIYVQSVARLWRFTGGRINDKIFHYEVGGEW